MTFPLGHPISLIVLMACGSSSNNNGQEICTSQVFNVPDITEAQIQAALALQQFPSGVIYETYPWSMPLIFDGGTLTSMNLVAADSSVKVSPTSAVIPFQDVIGVGVNSVNEFQSFSLFNAWPDGGVSFDTNGGILPYFDGGFVGDIYMSGANENPQPGARVLIKLCFYVRTANER